MLSSMGFQGVLHDLATVPQQNSSKDSAMERYRGMGLHEEEAAGTKGLA